MSWIATPSSEACCIRRRSAGAAVSTSVRRAASSSTLPGSKRYPFSPSCTRCGSATAFAATIGRPEAIASIVAIDCSSAIEAIAKTARPAVAGRAAPLRSVRPWKVTRASSPSVCVSCSRFLRWSPPPTMSNVHVQRRDRASSTALQQDVDALLGGQAADEQDAVAVARPQIRACSSTRSMPQLTGMTPVMSIVDSRKSAALRVGVVTARVRSNVRLASAHASLSMTWFRSVRERREVEDVLGHHVVRRDDRDAALARLARQPAPDHDVRLDVHDVGLHLVQRSARVVLRHPREHEA